MSIRDAKGKIMDKIPVKNVIVSVSDKSGLESFIPGLVEACPDIRFMSSTGTYTKIGEILSSDAEKHLIEVSLYTGTPEMEGGLVKTLDPKIHAGILGERNNPAHVQYLKEIGGEFIDIVVVNLYPFKQTISKKDVSFEQARGNIDIGGPTMLRGAAKNFLGCAPVCQPMDYGQVLKVIKNNGGCTTWDLRANLAVSAFVMTRDYEADIAPYLAEQITQRKDAIKAEYDIIEGGE